MIDGQANLAELGYRHQRIGFNYALRSSGALHANDATFWRAVGRRGGAAAADGHRLDRDRHLPRYVHARVLLPVPIVDLGDAFLEGLAQMRECYMPKAGFTRSTPLRIEETGYPTGPGRTTRPRSSRAAAALVRTAVAYRGTYGITDFRWFGLRDNNSEGPNFQSFFGLLETTTRRSRLSATTAGSSPGTAAADQAAGARAATIHVDAGAHTPSGR